ncbi:MAG: protein kinase family protein [Mycobacterium sp.]
MTDAPPGNASSGPTGAIPGPDPGVTSRIPRHHADEFQPDVLAEPPAAEETVHLRAGASVVDGRYRLLVFHGGPPHLQFWHALDISLNRQVALTFIDPGASLPDSAVREILSRTLKLSKISAPGLARILDVTRIGHGGLVISEWVRGGSLAEVAATGPSPMGGARAIQSLAATAESAHRAGVALSIDHPGRLRVSIEGDVVLAFPATLPSATPEDDISGIGAALYALLIDRWPLPESGAHSGMEPAERDGAGQPVEPRSVNREIPFQISAAAARSVQDGGGIRSAPTLLNLLQQATAVSERTELMTPVNPAVARPDRFRDDEPTDPDTLARRRKMVLIGIGVGAAILLVALWFVADTLIGSVGGKGLDEGSLGLSSVHSSTASNSPSGPSNIVKPVAVAVFSPGGGADNPQSAGKAISGTPGEAWSTDIYTDPAPFPGFKNGVGLMLQLPQQATPTSLSLNVTSTGTQIQVRSASSTTPASLDDTKVLTQPTTMQPGNNTIAINNASPTSYVLIWISTLGSVDGKSKTDISNVVLKAGS